MPYSGEERFHLVRFDDTDGREQLVLRSQGRLDVTSFDSRVPIRGRIDSHRGDRRGISSLLHASE